MLWRSRSSAEKTAEQLHFLTEGFSWYAGALGVAWSIMWFFLCFDTPAKHPRISTVEREYIEKALSTKPGAKVCKASLMLKFHFWNRLEQCHSFNSNLAICCCSSQLRYVPQFIAENVAKFCGWWKTVVPTYHMTTHQWYHSISRAVLKSVGFCED